MDDFRYEITPRKQSAGGGWRLQLFQGDVEVGGGVFPDYQDAIDEGEDWLASRGSN